MIRNYIRHGAALAMFAACLATVLATSPRSAAAQPKSSAPRATEPDVAKADDAKRNDAPEAATVPATDQEVNDQEVNAADSSPTTLTWLDDYATALKQAESAARPLVILFHDPAAAERTARFESDSLAAGAVRDLLAHCTLAKLPYDLRIRAGGGEFALLEHAAFAQLGGKPGLAVVDTVHRDSPKFRHVVAALPLADRPASQDALLALLERHVPEEALSKVAELHWHEDYAEAIRTAEREQRMLFVYFRNDETDAEQQQFEREALSNVRLRRKLGRFVLARLSRRTSVKVEGQPVELIQHASFSTMYGRQGIAIVDTTDANSRHFRQVVSAFPFSPRKRYDARRLSVILNLPRGTLTQRTLIYAVRTHPEAPASTNGYWNDMLANEAESHSQHQAEIDNQGHHNWGHRFQRISARLPGGMAAVEVCAESWPGEELVDAAEECVNSWRQSSGHWSAVRAAQPHFGYDMKLGSRAVWYATGIFGRH